MKLVEKFTSINGEGKHAGELAVFVRFPGCNLRCSYCDTMWANEAGVVTQDNSVDEIIAYIDESGAKHVTVTGGEPLLQEDAPLLFEAIYKAGKNIEIETNGSIDITPFIIHNPYVKFTMDYKMPSSKMEHKMLLSNLGRLRIQDTLKMVCGSKEDLEKVLEILPQVQEGVTIFLSPVFGSIEPSEIVDFMMEYKLSRVKLQLQLHKFIWHPDTIGV